MRSLLLLFLLATGCALEALNSGICATGQAFDRDGVCQSLCITAADCGNCARCQDGVCEDVACLGSECVTSHDCPRSAPACRSGVCQHCNSDAGCTALLGDPAVCEASGCVPTTCSDGVRK